MTKTFYVYLLASGPCGWLYVGVTNDLVRRVGEHKQGLIPGYTSEHGIDRLVWYETHQYIDQTILREKRIKRWLREWKFALVEESDPHWADLYGDLRAAQDWARFGGADRALGLLVRSSPISLRSSGMTRERGRGYSVRAIKSFMISLVPP